MNIYSTINLNRTVVSANVSRKKVQTVDHYRVCGFHMNRYLIVLVIEMWRNIPDNNSKTFLMVIAKYNATQNIKYTPS